MKQFALIAFVLGAASAVQLKQHQAVEDKDDWVLAQTEEQLNPNNQWLSPTFNAGDHFQVIKHINGKPACLNTEQTVSWGQKQTSLGWGAVTGADNEWFYYDAKSKFIRTVKGDLFLNPYDGDFYTYNAYFVAKQPTEGTITFNKATGEIETPKYSFTDGDYCIVWDSDKTAGWGSCNGQHATKWTPVFKK